MTKANQVAPLLATLRGLIPDATEAIDEFAKLAKYVDEVEARAEQAEYSLAASERALAALRYQAQAGGCELSTVGENSYNCRTDALCGLCRLRHRAEQAERSLATLRELIHTASGLDDHRYSAEQMVKEMAERWQGASDDCEKAERSLATVTGERDEARAELERRKEELRLAQCPNPRDPKNGGHCDTCSGLSVARTRQLHEQEQRIAELEVLNRDNLAMWEVERDALKARLAEAERERDEARAGLAAWHNIARSVGFAHEPYTGPVVVDAAARGAFADWCERNKEAVDGRAAAVDRLKYERDALQAKLAESTEWGSRACEVLGYVLGTLNLCDEQHWAFDPLNVEPVKDKAVAVRLLVRDLRSRLAKTEKVVDAARKWSECVERGFAASERPDVARARVLRALRVLDEDSGGSDGIATREDAGTAPSGSERSTPPEPAGIIPYVIGPPLRFDSRGAFDDDDSPVGVAATACDHKRQRCENDHAVCRDCGAVNRAVTGVVDWGPHETDRDDGSSGAVACPVCRCLKVGHHPGGCEGAGGNCGCTERFPEGRGRAVEKPDPQAPATRREVEELRWRVERLEKLTGFVPKE